MSSIHSSTMGSSVNECCCVIYDTTSFQSRRRKKRTKRWKMPQWPSLWGRPPLQDFFTLSWCVCSAHTPPVFALCCCEVARSWIPHPPPPPPWLALIQLLFVLGERLRADSAMWEQPSTNWWNAGLNWHREERGASWSQSIINSCVNFCVELLLLTESVCGYL